MITKTDAERIATFVWTNILGLEDDETAGSDHMDKADFIEWLGRIKS